MKAKVLRQKNDAELRTMLLDKQTELRSLRFKVNNSEAKNHRELRQLRRDIARLQTILTENKYLGREDVKGAKDLKDLAGMKEKSVTAAGQPQGDKDNKKDIKKETKPTKKTKNKP